MDAELDETIFREWLFSSRVLYISVLAVSAITLPILPFSIISLRKHRKSQYYVCLTAIIVGNIVLLSTILAMVVIEKIPFLAEVLQGSFLCKISAFLVDTSSCFIHWTWVLMYLQRCLCIFFPMKARRRRRFVYGWYGVPGVLLFSLVTQIWTPILMTERTVRVDGAEGVYCGAETGTGTGSMQLIALTQCLITFFVPFLLTVVTDISVLILRNPCQPQFIMIPAENMREELSVKQATYVKIVSSKIIANAELRRLRAIRRCLLMATLNLFLNLPNYCLQVFDEFLQLRNGENGYQLFFIRADAFFYVLYLLQFPLVPLYIYFLRGDLIRGSKRTVHSRTREQSRSHHISILNSETHIEH